MANTSQPWSEPASPTGRLSLEQWLPASIAPTVRRALELTAVAAAASWLGYYLIALLPYLDLEAFRATVTLHLVTGAVFLPYLVSLIVRRRLPGGSLLDVPIVVLAAVYLLATASSQNWRVSLEVTLVAFMAIGVFYVLSDGRLLKRWQVEAALMAAALAVALRALWIVGGDYLDWLQLTNAVTGGISLGDLIPPTVPKVRDVGDHPNIVGAILAMTLPFFVVALFRPLAAALRAGLALAVAALLMATFLSLARSAWLGAGTGVLTTGLLLLASTEGGRTLLLRLWPAAPRHRWLLAGGVAAVLAVGVVGALFVFQSVEARPNWLFRDSATPRADVMRAGVEMARDYPFVGTGPGVYGLLYPEYSGQNPNFAFHSHNGFLQTVVDLGTPGALAMVALAGSVGWLFLRGLRETDSQGRLSIAASAGALVAFATFSLFDAPNGFKGPLVALAAVAAIAVLSLRESTNGRESFRDPLASAAQLGARLAIPLLMVGLLVAWGRIDLAHSHYSSGVSNANAGRWSQAIEEAQRSVELDSDLAIYRLQLGSVLGQAYLDTRSPGLLEEAIRELRAGVELEPRSAIGRANLALLLAEARDRAGTREEAITAIAIANHDPAVVLAAGTALEATNWGDEAAEAYRRALFLDLNLVDSPFWDQTPFRRARFAQIVGSSAFVFNPCVLLSLARRDLPSGPLSEEEAFAACRVRAEEPGAFAARIVVADFLVANGDLDEASVLLDGVLARQPDNSRALVVLGRWHAAQGEVDEARAEWARAGQLGDVEALVLLGDSYAAGEVPPEVASALRSELDSAGSEVQRHLIGILYYRFKFFRGSPLVTILPGDWQAAVPGGYSRARDALASWAREAAAE